MFDTASASNGVKLALLEGQLLAREIDRATFIERAANLGHPDIAVDLHLSDEKVDLIGEGFDAALRIAVLEESSLVVKQLAPVRRFIVAAPSYLARYGRPRHPNDLTAHHCLGYANQAKRDVWRFTNKAGDGATVDAQIGDFREAA
jgi:LysR substrate binding domain